MNGREVGELPDWATLRVSRRSALRMGRDAVGLVLFTGATTQLIGCTLQGIPELVSTPRPKEVLDASVHYSLIVRDDGSLIDKQFQDTTRQQIAFGFDPNYANGSLRLGIHLNGTGEYQLYARDVSFGHDVVNDRFGYKDDYQEKHPVIGVKIGQIDRVYIGIVDAGQLNGGNSGISEDSYFTKMRAYEFVRRPTGLDGVFRGLATIDENQIHLDPTVR